MIKILKNPKFLQFLRRILRRIWYTFFKSHPYVYLGTITSFFSPEIYKQMKAELFQFHSNNFIHNLIRAKIESEYYLLVDENRRKANKSLFWGAETGKKWHDRNLLAPDDSYFKYKNPLYLQLRELHVKYPNFKTICEVGTGYGRFLDFLSKNLPIFDSFIGFDINREVILEAQRRFASNNKLRFIHSDILECLNYVTVDDIIIISCSSFMYFTEDELIELFMLLPNKFKNIVIGLSEPVIFDLDSNLSSKPAGGLYYNHNYFVLFQQCGYEIFYKDIQCLDSKNQFCNQIIIIATYT